VQEKWDELFTRYDGGFLLSRLVQTTTADFTTEEKAKEVDAFFAAHKAPAAERAVKQSVEKIRSNARWLANDGAAMGKWYDQFSAASVVVVPGLTFVWCVLACLLAWARQGCLSLDLCDCGLRPLGFVIGGHAPPKPIKTHL
jgi:hypothetical protein